MPGWWVDQPITDPTSGSSFYFLLLTFDFDFDPDPDPELDNLILSDSFSKLGTGILGNGPMAKSQNFMLRPWNEYYPDPDWIEYNPDWIVFIPLWKNIYWKTRNKTKLISYKAEKYRNTNLTFV